MQRIETVNIVDKGNDNNKLAELKIYGEKSDFREILIELLGKPDTNKLTLSGFFELNLSDLLDFNNLIEEKISEQNDLALKLFSANIIYDNGRSTLITDYRRLEQFYEMRSLSVVAIEMQWIFLLNFEDENNNNRTSKQEVNLSFDSTKYIDNVILDIKHTTKFWASEVEHIFHNKIKKIFTKPNFIYKKITNDLKDSFIASLMLVVMFSAGVFAYIDHTSISKSSRYLNEAIFNDIVDSYNGKKSNDNLDRKIDSIYYSNALNIFLKTGDDYRSKKLSEGFDRLNDEKIARFLSSRPESIFFQKSKKERFLRFLTITLTFIFIFLLSVSAFYDLFKQKSFILLTEKNIQEKKIL
ncbi:MAG: hypothetical protein SD837_17455 [Candidatus Electrothrix scaldis]|nr:MAG: hypothetical protein SD837_17455 [Candidatus Electrothrix sp. GW3-3]